MVTGTYGGYVLVERTYEFNDDSYIWLVAAFKGGKLVSIIHTDSDGNRKVFDNELNEISSYDASSDAGGGLIAYPFID